MNNGVLMHGLRAGAADLRGNQQTPEAMSARWQCKKRDGKIVPFDCGKIKLAVHKCFIGLLKEIGAEHDGYDQELFNRLIKSVVNNIAASNQTCPDVETLQRLVIQQLWSEGLFEAAEHYQNYREQRRLARAHRPVAPDVIARVAEDAKHFPSPIQYYQFISKFARWREEDKRRETWGEACTRVMDWFRGLPRVRLSDDEWQMMHDSLYNMETCCAMRVVQMAGPALERCHVGAYNCLAKETAFITSHGVRTFADFDDGDTTTVLTHTGKWQSATVRCYGTGKLLPLSIGRASNKHTVWATADHRWLLRDGTVTTKITDGDRLHKAPEPFLAWDYDQAEPDERLYWAYGMVYGDGTICRKNGEPCYSMLRLCSAKMKYLDRFTELGFSHSFPPSQSGEAMVYTGKYLKKLPAVAQTSLACLRAFVRGYLDADGTKNTNAHTSSPNLFSAIQVTGEEAIQFVREAFPVVGVYLNREEEVAEVTNYGKRSERTVRFGLLQRTGDSVNSSHFSVYHVDTPKTRTEEVWCLEVEEDHSFVLASGIVTGNCAYLSLHSLPKFAEFLYILMAGSGCGFSVEDHYISQLPRIKHQQSPPVTHTHVVADSTEGWCDALLFGLERWFAGEDVKFDVTRVRKKGTRLKTKGGRASGSEPLVALLTFARNLILTRQGKVLSDIDCHDLACMIGKIVQVGGVRRAATISISDLDSQAMRDCKSGNWYERAVWRTMANNSAAYDGRPDIDTFFAEFTAMVRSKSGERGIFNRKALERCMPLRRSRRYRMGGNPCMEIHLRPDQFCNLSIVIARPWDTRESLLRKVRVAARWGCMQKTATDFKYLGDEWRKNCEEEALLGVDITGHADCPLLRFGAPGRAELLRELKAVVAEVDTELSARFGVNRSAADTCVKPSGDSSVFFNCASGCSPWYADYIMRYVREPATSPVAKLLLEEGVPSATAPEDPSLLVFGFPRRAPEGATTRRQMSALDQLNNWLEWKNNWAEHSVSCTIFADDDEWPDVMAWCYRHFDEISGLSFMQRDNGVYAYAPNEELTAAEYEAAMASYPTINWSKLQHYEHEDMTQSAQTMACLGDKCELG